MNPVQIVGDIPEPQHWPLPMARFGRSPYQTNLFRIVFAPSVKCLVGGEFSDGFIGYRVRPAYRHIGNQWIMEKWISAWDHTKMTEEDYNLRFKDPMTGLCITGPYPSRGIYFHCHTFEACGPTDANIEKLVAWISKAKENSHTDNQRAILEAHAQKEKADDAQRFDRVKDMMSVSGIRAANIGGMVKKTKSQPSMKSANELGLPIRGARQIKPTESQLGLL
jgi:hypothetical protein